jgi:hypothetical protein
LSKQTSERADVISAVLPINLLGIKRQNSGEFEERRLELLKVTKQKVVSTGQHKVVSII